MGGKAKRLLPVGGFVDQHNGGARCCCYYRRGGLPRAHCSGRSPKADLTSDDLCNALKELRRNGYTVADFRAAFRSLSGVEQDGVLALVAALERK